LCSSPTAPRSPRTLLICSPLVVVVSTTRGEQINKACVRATEGRQGPTWAVDVLYRFNKSSQHQEPVQKERSRCMIDTTAPRQPLRCGRPSLRYMAPTLTPSARGASSSVLRGSTPPRLWLYAAAVRGTERRGGGPRTGGDTVGAYFFLFDRQGLKGEAGLTTTIPVLCRSLPRAHAWRPPRLRGTRVLSAIG